MREYGFIYLDYNEEIPNTTDITVGGEYKDYELKLNTGNVVDDFRYVLRWLFSMGAPEVIYSSTVDNLCTDSDLYCYDDDGMIARQVDDDEPSVGRQRAERFL